METGRDREVAKIVEHDRAVEVANLLMGKLNGPLRRINFDAYRSKPRRQLRSGVASLRDGQTEKLADWCETNFGTRQFRRLALLYESVLESNGSLRLPLKVFADLIGQPSEGVLRGAPRHSTVVVSPLGLQTEFPEAHLSKDMAVAFNASVTLGAEIEQHKGSNWDKVKEQKTRIQIADLLRRFAFGKRMCVLCCFNLIEAYINGVSWEFVETHDISGLSKKKQDVLTSVQASILDKVVKVPEIVTGKSPGPLRQEEEPLKSFKEIIKPFRDSIVHASPFSAPERFGGYDKLSKIYGLGLETVRSTVNLTSDIISRIHRFLGCSGNLPQWFPLHGVDGKLNVENLR